MAPRKQITLVDIYRERGFKLTREQARKIVTLMRLTEERPASTAARQTAKPDAA